MSTLNTFRQLQPNGASNQSAIFFVGNNVMSWYLKVSENSLYLTNKRLLDCVLASLALVALAPLMLFVALLIKIESKGPVFFSQTRIGQNGRAFQFWKFRSMRTDAEALQAQLDKFSDSTDLRFKMAADPRITRVGKIIRKFSIDELPQLWNVLKGDMSLVGPRPPLPNEVAKYNTYQQRRLSVVPGITCTWQIGGRSDIPFEQQVDMDIAYIRNRSLLEDLKILFKTPFAVLACKGAY
ncbi:MAG: sugar transferase [Pseudomonadales bacterium]